MFRIIRNPRESAQRFHRFLTYDVWHIGAVQGEDSGGFIVKQVRVAFLVLKSIIHDQLTVRAAALTFTTMLAAIPYIVFMFYIITSFNLSEDIYGYIQAKVESRFEQAVPPGEAQPALPGGDGTAPIAAESGPPEAPAAVATPGEPTPTADAAADASENEDKSTELLRETLEALVNPASADDDAATGTTATAVNPINWIIDRAREAGNSNALGVAGLIFVLTTVFGLMRDIEDCFNGIWGLQQTRSYYQRFSNYLVVTLLLPFAIAVVMGIVGALQSETVLTHLGYMAPVLQSVQILIIWLLFTLLYVVIPNTRVNVRYALLGGLVAAVLWSLASWGYFKAQYGLAKYNLVYLAFAQFPLILVWMYFSWVIVLLGAVLTFAYQNEKTFALEQLAENASESYREGVGLCILIELAQRFEAGRPPLLPGEVAEAWNVPVRLVNDCLETLKDKGLVVACATEPVTYLPARSPQRIQVGEVLQALRSAGRDPSGFLEESAMGALLEAINENRDGLARQSIAEAAAKLEAGPDPDETADRRPIAFPSADKGRA